MDTPSQDELSEARRHLREILARFEAEKPVADLRANAGFMRGEFVYPKNFLDPDPEIEELFGMR